MIKSKRGRPAKQKFGQPMGFSPTSDYSSQQKNITYVREAVRGITQSFSLTTDQVDALSSNIVCAGNHYLAAQQLRKLIHPKTRGNRCNFHVQILLADCARAWANATGKKAAIWEKDPIKKDEDARIDGANESVSVKLARITIKLMTGLESTGSLRQQIKKAHKISFG